MYVQLNIGRNDVRSDNYLSDGRWQAFQAAARAAVHSLLSNFEGEHTTEVHLRSARWPGEEDSAHVSGFGDLVGWFDEHGSEARPVVEQFYELVRDLAVEFDQTWIYAFVDLGYAAEGKALYAADSRRALERQYPAFTGTVQPYPVTVKGFVVAESEAQAHETVESYLDALMLDDGFEIVRGTE